MFMFLRKEAANAKERMKHLNRKDKARYILHYYWLWFGALLGAVILAVYLIWHIFFTVKEYWFYGVFVNLLDQNIAADSDFYDGFVSYGDYDLSEKNVVFNTSTYFDATQSGGTNNSYFQAFVAMIESGDLDTCVMEKDNLIKIGESGRLLDLSSEKAEEFFEKYESRLIYCTPFDTEYSKGQVPVGIDISDSILMTEYHLYDQEDGCALGIGAYASNLDAVETFLDYIKVEADQ